MSNVADDNKVANDVKVDDNVNDDDESNKLEPELSIVKLDDIDKTNGYEKGLKKEKLDSNIELAIKQYAISNNTTYKEGLKAYNVLLKLINKAKSKKDDKITFIQLNDTTWTSQTFNAGSFNVVITVVYTQSETITNLTLNPLIVTGYTKVIGIGAINLNQAITVKGSFSPFATYAVTATFTTSNNEYFINLSLTASTVSGPPQLVKVPLPFKPK